MATPRSRSDIYTIGHSNAPAERVVALLRAQQIDVLVDVRSIPASRHAPEFNRRAFTQTLTEAGIRYLYMGEPLGGRPRDPACYKEGILPRGHADYLNLVDYAKVIARPWYQRAVRDLMHIGREWRTAIMCSEEDPRRCHRLHLIAQTLTASGITVYHIRHRGPLEVGLFDVAYLYEGVDDPLPDPGAPPMRLYTVGFTKKSAARFFSLLKENDVQRLIDIRLRPNGQLAGFTKRDDLAYFLPNLINCEYHHTPSLAPTGEILSTYRKNKDWNTYVQRFEALMDQRNMPFALDRAFYEEKACCLLCSEATPEQCHRRLVAERIARSWADTEVIHL
ncbi:MAG: DUF488 domain-containing protein [Thermomicrobia bacterium]|nr:DUF488 domain-containing protein [Thermomicrobia bacterium]MCA1723904.1 DUF488 domain-containing protein [Thermomicrobia bacterium]